MNSIWRKKYKTVFVFVVVGMLIAAGGLYYFKQRNAPAAVENTVAVTRGDIKQVVAATGTISPLNSVEISSRVTGLITDVKVKENDLVKAGQVLLVLDDTSLKAQVAQYYSQLQNYSAIYERSKKLAAVGGQSDQQLDADMTNYLVAKSNYDNYSSQLEYYVIKSPVDGMVIGKPTPAGQTVAQGISTPQVIMTIADMSQMQIKVLVDETDIGKVKLGQNVTFTVDSYTDQSFSGKVTSISRSATTSSNVIYYPVYVDVESSEGLLFPTMTARVNIETGAGSGVLVLPAAAVKEENGQKYVQLKVNGQTQKQPVQVGLSDDSSVEIISGLQEGESVILPAVKPSTAAGNRMGPPLF
ncbi:efflux RND transporter periplasmic adaptor subunit|uniref:HlyD family secretion protein n=1 Tax=Dendrosporobacter quercicolus TaxID=146817 RepID=A0A1G9VUU8_9FIRM|nr:efflux RND transporter periplasmic adaptor subunit [Dendrosporobacter quercicolus]NSL47792.1 efflux RND transporter periplasmic adaptor subunit [Dendrosporobacter quercicolus DSM 1736]SDM76018.1 HlyD family secretion protein [Dendrosporobacter quercicolus]